MADSEISDAILAITDTIIERHREFGSIVVEQFSNMTEKNELLRQRVDLLECKVQNLATVIERLEQIVNESFPLVSSSATGATSRIKDVSEVSTPPNLPFAWRKEHTASSSPIKIQPPPSSRRHRPKSPVSLYLSGKLDTKDSRVVTAASSMASTIPMGELFVHSPDDDSRVRRGTDSDILHFTLDESDIETTQISLLKKKAPQFCPPVVGGGGGGRGDSSADAEFVQVPWFDNKGFHFGELGDDDGGSGNDFKPPDV
jgi:hypothetical protein